MKYKDDIICFVITIIITYVILYLIKPKFTMTQNEDGDYVFSMNRAWLYSAIIAVIVCVLLKFLPKRYKKFNYL